MGVEKDYLLKSNGAVFTLAFKNEHKVNRGAELAITSGRVSISTIKAHGAVR